MSHAQLHEWIAPPHTALCIIDYQVDFASPDGLLGKAGVPMEPVIKVKPGIEKLIDQARNAGVAVIFVGLKTSPQTDSPVWTEWMRRSGQNPDEAYAICRESSGGEEFYQLTPQAEDLVIWKPKYSAFVGTDLEKALHEKGITTLVTCGITTECCVDSTVRDAFQKDFSVFIAADACAAYEQDMHDTTLKILTMSFAIPLTLEEITQAWSR